MPQRYPYADNRYACPGEEGRRYAYQQSGQERLFYSPVVNHVQIPDTQQPVGLMDRPYSQSHQG